MEDLHWQCRLALQHDGPVVHRQSWNRYREVLAVTPSGSGLGTASAPQVLARVVDPPLPCGFTSSHSHHHPGLGLASYYSLVHLFV